MRVFSLKCFGIGDGWPNADRNHSAFLYRFGPVTCLVDCGGGIGRAYKASGLDYNAIDRILLSHLHFDHVGDFFMLLQGFWLERRTKDLTVHLPGDGITPIRQMLHAGCVFEELLAFRLEYSPLQAGVPLAIGDVRVTPHSTSHLAGLRAMFQHQYPHSFAAFSFLFETEGLRIAHTADLGAVEDLEPLVQEPLDLLVCELAHFQPEKLYSYLRGRPIKKLVFIHVARPLWQDLEATRRAALEGLGGLPCVFARDGDEFTV